MLFKLYVATLGFFFQTSPQLLQLLRRIMQFCFAMKLRKYFMDEETSPDFPSTWMTEFLILVELFLSKAINQSKTLVLTITPVRLCGLIGHPSTFSTDSLCCPHICVCVVTGIWVFPYTPPPPSCSPGCVSVCVCVFALTR